MWKRNTFETKPLNSFSDPLENLEYGRMLVGELTNKTYGQIISI